MVDVASAFAIGVVAVAVLTVWSPAPYDSLARASQERARYSTGLYEFVTREGLTFLQDSAFPAVCAAAAGASNPTLELTAEGCGRGPPAGSAYASLALDFPGRDLVLLAW